jgi:hypothetical protein
METNSLTEIIKSRRQVGEGVFSSIGGSAKEKLKEKLDWRRALPQGGLLTSLFPKLKAYQAKKADSPTERILIGINKDFSLFAKNSKKLQSIANNFTVMKKDVNKLAKIYNVTPANTVDRADDSIVGESGTSPTKMQTEKEGFNLFLLLAAVAAVGAAVTLGYDKIKQEFDETVTKALKPLTNFGSDLFKEFENMFDWTKVKFSEIKNLGGDVIDFFKDNFSKLFSIDTLTKIKEIANRVIARFLGGETSSTSTEMYDPEKERTAGEAEGQKYVRDRAAAERGAAQTDPAFRSPRTPTRMGQMPSGESTDLGDLIASGESGVAGYNAYNKGTIGNKIIGSDKPINFSEMTIEEYFKRAELRPNDPNKLFAVGRYQIIPSTMRGIVNALRVDPKTTYLTPEVQESFFQYLLNTAGTGKLNAYLKGKSDDLNAAILDLSRVWAAVGVPYDKPDGKPIKKGQSYYSGVGGNKASISPEVVGQALIAQRQKELTPAAPSVTTPTLTSVPSSPTTTGTLTPEAMVSAEKTEISPIAVDQQPKQIEISQSPANKEVGQQASAPNKVFLVAGNENMMSQYSDSGRIFKEKFVTQIMWNNLVNNSGFTG